MSGHDLTITINVKQGPSARYADIEVDKPVGMNMSEVIGWIEQAKMDLILGGIIREATENQT